MNVLTKLGGLLKNTFLCDVKIKSLALELENDIYYLKEFFPNDRNAFLFLDIFSNQIGKILGELKMYESLIMLSSYDADNKLIYNSYLK